MVGVGALRIRRMAHSRAMRAPTALLIVLFAVAAAPAQAAFDPAYERAN